MTTLCVCVCLTIAPPPFQQFLKHQPVILSLDKSSIEGEAVLRAELYQSWGKPPQSRKLAVFQEPEKLDVLY